MQLIVRLFVLLVNITVNVYLLEDFRAGANQPWFIVAFNAALIFVIFAVDLTIVTWRKLHAEINIGKRIIDGNLNEV